ELDDPDHDEQQYGKDQRELDQALAALVVRKGAPACKARHQRCPPCTGSNASQRGSEKRSTVGPPVRLSISKEPPSMRIRSPSPPTPRRPRGPGSARDRLTSKPRPLSMTRTSTEFRRI